MENKLTVQKPTILSDREMLDIYRTTLKEVFHWDLSTEAVRDISHTLTLDFNNQIKYLWSYDLADGWNVHENRKKYLKIQTPIQLVHEVYYDTTKSAFIQENWDDLPYIIEVLHDYINDLIDYEKAKEEANNTAATEDVDVTINADAEDNTEN